MAEKDRNGRVVGGLLKKSQTVMEVDEGKISDGLAVAGVQPRQVL